MLHELPITNVRLNPCHEDWQQMTYSGQGRYCASCDREVIDFTAAQEPELAWARIASPDGRVCGRLRTEQLAPASRPGWRLRPALRVFLTAVVLVLLQGLTAQQAWAQVHRANQHAAPASTPLVGDVRLPTEAAIPTARFEGRRLYEFADRMPEYRAGGIQGLQRDVARLAQELPAKSKATGIVFVRFVVDRTGRRSDVRVVKSVGTEADAQALHVVRQLAAFSPGQQGGQPVDVVFTVPVAVGAGNE